MEKPTWGGLPHEPDPSKLVLHVITNNHENLDNNLDKLKISITRGRRSFAIYSLLLLFLRA